MIRLERDVKVHTFEAEATVAVGRNRPEFLAVARLAADLQRPLDGGTVAQELLGGLPAQTGWRVIDRCLALGLLERQAKQGPAKLSESGARALAQGAVLVPEEGIWRFYLIDDPLIDLPLVHVVRLEASNAREERDLLNQAKTRGENRPSLGAPAPGSLAQETLLKRFLTSVVHGRGFEVRDLAPRGEPGPSGSLRLSLEWSPKSAPQLVLQGRLPMTEERAQADVDLQAGTPIECGAISYEEVWRTLVSAARRVPIEELAQWQSTTQRHLLPVSLDASLPEAARRTMQMDLESPSTRIGRLGQFNPARLRGVDLVPRSEADAQAWAEWLQWDALDRYVTPTGLLEKARQVTARFSYHRPHLPDPKALLARALRTPLESRSRFLLAPSDLGLWS
ncbi:hypothetical protein POL68_42660 [Stigmatella sp. ncwal1]|uniref:Helicase XPB/Ssl2 N-terminal domain-containing protein n=1 Tax=Stigmatella ashevillensis TaxID=2995309 RepID=A0ABT5DQ21_9BACT|nr:hypothetical protein [Stigmatella ashevillena]MDC0715228.1 hypothetical protein [Stigmatella ashevillena]